MTGFSSAVPRRLARRGTIIAAAAAATLGGTSAASAASFTVIDPSDAALSNPAGTTCVSTEGGGRTLRAAVQKPARRSTSGSWP